MFKPVTLEIKPATDLTTDVYYQIDFIRILWKKNRKWFTRRILN